VISVKAQRFCGRIQLPCYAWTLVPSLPLAAENRQRPCRHPHAPTSYRLCEVQSETGEQSTRRGERVAECKFRKDVPDIQCFPKMVKMKGYCLWFETKINLIHTSTVIESNITDPSSDPIPRMWVSPRTGGIRVV
jgi:hypothetical protein